MGRYHMKDGTVTDTRLAQQTWAEDSVWDGRNRISKATGSQWLHERLYRSAKGRYYVERWSAFDGNKSSAEYLSREEAARWLLANDHELPADLSDLHDEVME